MSPTRDTPLEKSIVDKIQRYLRSLPRCVVRKVYGGPMSGAAGQPDLDICINGRTVKLEVKRPGGRLTELQRKSLEQWANAGAVTGVVHSRAETEHLLRHNGLLDFIRDEP